MIAEIDGNIFLKHFREMAREMILHTWGTPFGVGVLVALLDVTLGVVAAEMVAAAAGGVDCLE